MHFFRLLGEKRMLLLLAGASAFSPQPLAASSPRRHAWRAPICQSSAPPVRISIFGVGGGGSNAVNRMVEAAVDDGRECVKFITCNTDQQALMSSLADDILQLGSQCTRGLGAGGRPEVGTEAAVESISEIAQMVSEQDMVFVTAGMGGGTGSGAAPVVARCAREAGALTVGVVSKPFSFEGKRRMSQATTAIEALRRSVDVLIVVSNDRLLDIVPEGMSMSDSFALADEVLRQGIVGLTDLVTKPGLVNVDYADVCSIMRDSGFALMGVGRGFGPTRAEDAAIAAISSPLLEFPMQRARRVIFSVTGGSSMTLQHVNTVAQSINDFISEDANIIFGAAIEEELGDELMVTVIATDFPDDADGFE
jgi:cell division protein FtsZ